VFFHGAFGPHRFIGCEWDCRASIEFGRVLKLRMSSAIHQGTGSKREPRQTAHHPSPTALIGSALTLLQSGTAPAGWGDVARILRAAALQRALVRVHAASSVNPNTRQESILTKPDNQLKQDIETELEWDPKVNAAQIGVSVDGGVVTLLGSVDTYAAKWAAEDATKRVSGVRTVAQDLTVKISAGHKRSDSEIAAAVQGALNWNVNVPESVTARVHEGSVTLEGAVTWHYQRDAAERAVRYLVGVVAVYNAVTLMPDASSAVVRENVQAALHRQATADAKSIRVDTSGGKVTLTGHASSWQSIEDAASAAWAAPGVTEVIDQVKMSMTI